MYNNDHRLRQQRFQKNVDHLRFLKTQAREIND
jgi:hypothetical protein